MEKKLLILVVLLSSTIIPSTPLTMAQPAFQPLGHIYVYDVQSDGNVKCTWKTDIKPLQSNIIYPFTFRGGSISGAMAMDSLGQELDIDATEQNGQTTLNLYLTGYPLNQPYSFNFTFTWSGLLTRKSDKHTLFTSVNIGETQATKIVVILPKGAKLGTSTLWRGNITEVFDRQLISERDALVWQVADTGNETEIFFIVNFKFYSGLLWIQDNIYLIIATIVIVIIAAILLGYRKPARRLISKALRRVSDKV